MSMIASSPYTYTLLDEAAYEIKILTLHPGAFTDPVTVSLKITSFTPGQVLVFEALSYAWGSPENPENILVGSPRSQATTLFPWPRILARYYHIFGMKINIGRYGSMPFAHKSIDTERNTTGT
jgi:hypothetical protein